MGSTFRHEREDGRTVSGGVMTDGVVLGVFFNGHNEGVIALSIEEALDLAARIQATYCPSCHGLKGEHDGEVCSDCARNQAAREEAYAEETYDDEYCCQICGQPGGH